MAHIWSETFDGLRHRNICDKISLIFILAVALVGCESVDESAQDSSRYSEVVAKVKRLDKGMLRGQVEDILGPFKVGGCANISGIKTEIYGLTPDCCVVLDYASTDASVQNPKDSLLFKPDSINVLSNNKRTWVKVQFPD